MGQKWPDCDSAARQYLESFTRLLQAALGANLVGVYLHGSLAMGSYYPPKSDMDVLAVVKTSLTPARAAALLRDIAMYSDTRPTVGDIEFSLITAAAAKAVPNPMPYELHYSSSWHDRILRNEVSFDVPQYDSDLFAHLLCLQQRGVCLYGEPVESAIGEAAWADFLFAVLDDLDWVLGDENILESPYYCIFNACRVLQLLETGVREVFSKEEGALWGLENLPAMHAPVIRQALEVYRSSETITEEERRRGGVAWDGAALLAFRDYARARRKALARG